MECNHRRHIWRRAAWHVTGLLALLWFLIRVIPKPSRALYPCQRAAFPYASAFVVWLIAGSGAASLLRKAQRHVCTRRYVAAAGCVAFGVLCLWLAMAATSDNATLAQAGDAHGPLGQGRGLFPGRVVWVHDPNATSWAGRSLPSDPLYTSQPHVDAMVAQAIRLLSGETDDKSYFDLHQSLAYNKPQAGQYRTFVDIMGHPDLGAKTLLYLIDGLYGGSRWQAAPERFKNPPFNNDWPSTILASLDPVAIDSVGLDIVSQEWPDVVRIPGVDDYLHEAALANDPPSGTLYDPDGDGKPLRSLGAHEHWNNATDRKYSSNLGKETGIELIYTHGEKRDK